MLHFGIIIYIFTYHFLGVQRNRGVVVLRVRTGVEEILIKFDVAVVRGPVLGERVPPWSSVKSGEEPPSKGFSGVGELAPLWEPGLVLV